MYFTDFSSNFKYKGTVRQYAKRQAPVIWRSANVQHSKCSTQYTALSIVMTTRTWSPGDPDPGLYTNTTGFAPASSMQWAAVSTYRPWSSVPPQRGRNCSPATITKYGNRSQVTGKQPLWHEVGHMNKWEAWWMECPCHQRICAWFGYIG